MRIPLASAADQSAVSFRPSQGAGERRQFVVRRPTAGRGTRLACVPFGNVVSARREIVLVVPAAGSSGRLVASIPVSRSGIWSCGNEGGYQCGEGRGCAVSSPWGCCGAVHGGHHVLQLLLRLLQLLSEVLIGYC